MKGLIKTPKITTALPKIELIMYYKWKDGKPTFIFERTHIDC